VAQRYAGYFIGHPYRQDQQDSTPAAFHISRAPWREPPVISDHCLFCQHMTDLDVLRRVAGFQHQLDIEACRNKGQHYAKWVESGYPRVPEPGIIPGSHSAANLRRFVELFQDSPVPARAGAWAREALPDGWRTRPLPLVALPHRLKRKLCIEWNALLLDWMVRERLSYDFELREFYRLVAPKSANAPEEAGC